MSGESVQRNALRDAVRRVCPSLPRLARGAEGKDPEYLLLDPVCQFLQDAPHPLEVLRLEVLQVLPAGFPEPSDMDVFRGLADALLDGGAVDGQDEFGATREPFPHLLMVRHTAPPGCGECVAGREGCQ